MLAGASLSHCICQEVVVRRPEKISKDFLKLDLRRAVEWETF